MMIKSKEISNEEIIEGIKNRDEKIARHILKSCFWMVEEYIKSKGGTTEDAWEVFQYTYIAMYQKTTVEDVVLYVNFPSYFLGFCKNYWLKELLKRKRSGYLEEQDEEIKGECDEIIKQIIKKEKYNLYVKFFNKLPGLCRIIFLMHFKKIPYKQIAKELGLTENQVKRKKFGCKEKLIKLIMKDPRYNQLR